MNSRRLIALVLREDRILAYRRGRAPRCASQQNWTADVREGSIASVRVCWPYVRSYPDSDRNRDLRARRLKRRPAAAGPISPETAFLSLSLPEPHRATFSVEFDLSQLSLMHPVSEAKHSIPQAKIFNSVIQISLAFEVPVGSLITKRHVCGFLTQMTKHV
jgi:hypothetical protein